MRPTVTTSRSVLTVTTGEAGSGKSYTRCAAFLTTHFLKESEGIHFSNFPLGVIPESHSHKPEFEGETFVDRIAKRVAKKNDDEEVLAALRARIQIIPKEVLDSWEKETSGPWEYFKEQNLQDAHITIDEIHNFIGPESSGPHKKRWYQWIGELRHSGAKLEVISQNRGKIPIEVRREAGFWIHCKNTETERDPFFGIELGDWYELRGLITGRYTSSFVEEIRREVLGKEGKPIERRLHKIDPQMFGLYDSYSAPQKSGVKGTASKREFQKRNPLGLLIWFLSRNIGRIIPKLALVAFFAWLLFGGSKTLFNWGMSFATLSKKPDAQQISQPPSAHAPNTAPLNTTLSGANPIPIPSKVTPAIISLPESEELELTVLAFIEDRCLLSDGQAYGIGDTLSVSSTASARITAISPKSRHVKLSNGSTLRLGRSAIVPRKTPTSVTPGLRTNTETSKPNISSPTAPGLVSGPANTSETPNTKAIPVLPDHNKRPESPPPSLRPRTL